MWLNKSIAPNGTTYTETSAAGGFSRTGISASVANAAGYTWATTVWFNGYSSSGNATATQNGPRGWGITKAKYTYAWYQAGDKASVKAWLLDAKLNGTGRSSTLGLLEDDEAAGVPKVASVTAEDLRAGAADGFTLTSYGSTEGGELWTGTGFGQECIFIAQGDYVSSSCNPSDLAAEHGVAIHALSADGTESVQAVLSPNGGITEENSAEAGLTALSDKVAINTAAPIAGELEVSNTKARGGAQGLVIPLVQVEG
ncbi:hypothetical protein KZC52_08645 [Microbacterium sp. kSW2-24]|uniref:hypothetical protein n=1 Tax=Microbacterium galbinum TaxID=2851646 RepID=UPI001FFC79EB|nr:hypothetical protein [Microbacterium galbinum]MCK2022987.1 hypothetical protein [Microbacterium galbinum]